MTNMSIQPLWLTHFIEILLVPKFQLTKFIVGAFSYKAHFRPQISSNGTWWKKIINLELSLALRWVFQTPSFQNSFIIVKYLPIFLIPLSNFDSFLNVFSNLGPYVVRLVFYPFKDSTISLLLDIPHQHS